MFKSNGAKNKNNNKFSNSRNYFMGKFVLIAASFFLNWPMEAAAFSHELNQQKFAWQARVFDAHTILQSTKWIMTMENMKFGCYCELWFHLPAVVCLALLFQGGSLFRSLQIHAKLIWISALLFLSNDSLINFALRIASKWTTTALISM